MAYQTGSGGDVSAFFAAIRDFAVAQGWTKSGEGTNATGGYLFLEKGVCHMAAQYYTNWTVTAYDANGDNYTLTNNGLRATVGSGIDTARTVYWGHPGYPHVGSEIASENYYYSTVKDLTGPLTAWHLFSDEGGNYIHAAVNTQADRWVHFGFGNADIGSFTHSGVGYVTGTNNIWYRDSNNIDPTNYGFYHYNNPRAQQVPFTGANSIYYVPDALTSDFPKFAALNRWSSGDSVSFVNPTITTASKPEQFPLNGTGSAMLDAVIAASTPAWSGQVPMHGSPLLVRLIDYSKYCIVGMYPNVRVLNMEGLLPGSEITLGTDTWKVFPIMRQNSWSASGTLTLTSGQYAVAHKKIV